jgi:hypothetical protein
VGRFLSATEKYGRATAYYVTAERMQSRHYEPRKHAYRTLLKTTGSWYLIALGTIAVITMLVAPRGMWPFVRDRLGIEWLSISRKLPAVASDSSINPKHAGAIPPGLIET